LQAFQWLCGSSQFVFDFSKNQLDTGAVLQSKKAPNLFLLGYPRGPCEEAYNTAQVRQSDRNGTSPHIHPNSASAILQKSPTE